MFYQNIKFTYQQFKVATRNDIYKPVCVYVSRPVEQTLRVLATVVKARQSEAFLAHECWAQLTNGESAILRCSSSAKMR